MPPRDTQQNVGTLAADFQDFIACMNAAAVVFVLVGGYAVGWYGVIRATGDIDFLYEPSVTNVDRLCAALREFGAPPRLIDPAFLQSPDAVTQIGREPLRIDLLASLTGVSFAEVLAGSVPIDLDGQALRVIGIEALRRNKQATGRPRDIQDLRALPVDDASAPGVRRRNQRSLEGKSSPRSGRRRDTK